MEASLLTALVGLGGVLSGAWISHLLTERRLQREFAENYRNILFSRQLAAYQQLWSLLLPTSRYCSESTILDKRGSGWVIRVSAAKAFCDKLTEFFFSEHGLYLSKSTRRALFSTRDIVQKLIMDASASGLEEHKLDPAKRKEMRESFINLQTVIRNDMGLRALKFRPTDIGVDEGLLEP
jgi:hypothetical protein